MATATSRRTRLDLLLVERGLAATRARAQALVMAGQVRVGDGDAARTDLKAGDLVANDAPVTVAAGRRWVSRGAHKLLAALDAFGIEVEGKVAVDVGASTGGFTDVLLERGAAGSTPSTSGYGQLAERLRRDPRVVSMERVNARTLTADTLPEPVDLAVVDVVVHLARPRPRPGPLGAARRPRPDRRPGQAPVRGRTGGGEGRRRARPRRPPPGPPRGDRAGGRARPRDARRHRLADPGPRGQPRVPASTSRPARRARSSRSGSRTRSRPPGRTRERRR